MRVLVMAGNYAPEKTASAPLTADFCRYLTAAGHSVSVVTTFPHYPQWRVWQEYRGHFYAKETIDGVRVYRILNYAVLDEPWLEAEDVELLCAAEIHHTREAAKDSPIFHEPLDLSFVGRQEARVLNAKPAN